MIMTIKEWFTKSENAENDERRIKKKELGDNELDEYQMIYIHTTWDARLLSVVFTMRQSCIHWSEGHLVRWIDNLCLLFIIHSSLQSLKNEKYWLIPFLVCHIQTFIPHAWFKSTNIFSYSLCLIKLVLKELKYFEIV